MHKWCLVDVSSDMIGWFSMWSGVAGQRHSDHGITLGMVFDALECDTSPPWSLKDNQFPCVSRQLGKHFYFCFYNLHSYLNSFTSTTDIVIVSYRAFVRLQLG